MESLAKLVGMSFTFEPDWENSGSAVQGPIVDGIKVDYSIEDDGEISIDGVYTPHGPEMSAALPESVIENLAEQARDDALNML